MWDQPYKSSPSHQEQSSYYRAAPRYSNQVPRNYRDTHRSADYTSSPTDSSSDYTSPRHQSYEDSPPNRRQHVKRAMGSEHATKTRESRDVYGFSQPEPGYQPRPSGRPQYRTRSPDSDCIEQDSQSDDDYIASPEFKKNGWVDRKPSHDERYNDSPPRNSSPARNSRSRNYSNSPPSDYAPHPEAKSDSRTVKEGWGNSHSFSQSHRLKPREQENYREAKQFIDSFQKLHTHSTDRSDTESYSGGDGSPTNRRNKSYQRHLDPERDDDDYCAPSRYNYRERDHGKHARSKDRYCEFDDDDNQRNHVEARSRNPHPPYNHPRSSYSNADDQYAASFSARPTRHVDHSPNRPSPVYPDHKNNTHTTAYSDIASRPSTSHSDRLSRVPTAVDAEEFSSPPPSVPSPPLYHRSRQQRRSGSDYGRMPGSFQSSSRSRSRSRSRSPYTSSPIPTRNTHLRPKSSPRRRRTTRYTSDSDDNGVAEGSDYLPSASGSDEDDERISVDGRRIRMRTGNRVAGGSDYVSSLDGRSDVCERDGWRSRGSGDEEEEGYGSDGYRGDGREGGRAYGGRW